MVTHVNLGLHHPDWIDLHFPSIIIWGPALQSFGGQPGFVIASDLGTCPGGACRPDFSDVPGWPGDG